METTTKQQPVFKKQMRLGIAAAVFEKQVNGNIYRSVNVQKNYFRNDKWNRHTIYLDHVDIPFMIEALKATWDYLNEAAYQSEPAQELEQEIAS